jgi:hypothetical protein
MDLAWPRRMLWRRRGAWLWPAFAAATVADAAIGHGLPLTGEGEALAAAVVVGLVLNLVAIVVLSWPLGALVRRARPDMPTIVARDYAGTIAVMAIAVLLLAGGLVHHASVVHDRNAMRDATVRAQAFIGDQAPAEFRSNLEWVSMFAIEPGSLYRACVPGRQTGRTYCVIVDERRPFATSVRFGGYEPNSLFSEGVN